MFARTDSQGRTGCRRPGSALLLGSIIGLAVAATVVLRRRGYRIGGNTVVRCRQGHLFTTA